MAGGIYSESYFKNYPEEKDVPGILYCVILVNKKTNKRECLKIGMAKGTTFKNVIKRSNGFKGYDIRIQRTWTGTLFEVWMLEQSLHRQFHEYRYVPSQKFGGHTECFDIRPEIIKAIPVKK